MGNYVKMPGIDFPVEMEEERNQSIAQCVRQCFERTGDDAIQWTDIADSLRHILFSLWYHNLLSYETIKSTKWEVEMEEFQNSICSCGLATLRRWFIHKILRDVRFYFALKGNTTNTAVTELLAAYPCIGMERYNTLKMLGSECEDMLSYRGDIYYTRENAAEREDNPFLHTFTLFKNEDVVLNDLSDCHIFMGNESEIFVNDNRLNACYRISLDDGSRSQSPGKILALIGDVAIKRTWDGGILVENQKDRYARNTVGRLPALDAYSEDRLWLLYLLEKHSIDLVLRMDQLKCEAVYIKRMAVELLWEFIVRNLVISPPRKRTISYGQMCCGLRKVV